MTELLYLKDSNTKEFDATVTHVLPIGIILDKTYFYPSGGGQPSDTGVLSAGGRVYTVTEVKKMAEGAVHVIPEVAGLKEGMRINGMIDWNRRYTLMRHHTSCHLLSALIHEKTGALITGNQLGIEQSRVDFDLEQFDRVLIEARVEEANRLIQEKRKVKVYFMPREKALQQEGMVKLANKLPPEVKDLRIVEIEGVDIQADGGTHVADLGEIGTIVLVKLENKGKNNRRLYYSLKQ